MYDAHTVNVALYVLQLQLSSLLQPFCIGRLREEKKCLFAATKRGSHVTRIWQLDSQPYSKFAKIDMEHSEQRQLFYYLTYTSHRMGCIRESL